MEANKPALKAAAHWFAVLSSGEATEVEHRAWSAWLDEHPDHRWAWQQVEALQGRMQSLPGKLSAAAFRIASSDAGARGRNLTRRNALKGLGIVLVGGSAAGLGLSHTRWWEWPADYRTAVGARRETTLADGSTLILNTDTVVDVDFDAGRRVVKLRSGEILIDTAADPAAVSRPFVIETAQGSIHALGTRFTVRRHDDLTAVMVLSDAVEVRPADAPLNGRVIHANQQARFSRGEVRPPQPADELQAAWTRGMVVAIDWRLADLVAEIARYRSGRLACDPAVAGLRISGSFPIHDTDIALTAIERALPVRAVRRTRYWVSIERG